MNVQWRPYGWNQPGAEELPPLRKNANFVGVLMLALVGASMTLPSGLLMLLQVLGAADLAQVNYGLDKMGYLFFQTAAYLLYLALPAIVVALIMRRDLRPFPSRRVQPSVLIPAVMVGLGLMGTGQPGGQHPDEYPVGVRPAPANVHRHHGHHRPEPGAQPGVDGRASRAGGGNGFPGCMQHCP